MLTSFYPRRFEALYLFAEKLFCFVCVMCSTQGFFIHTHSNRAAAVDDVTFQYACVILCDLHNEDGW